MNLSVIIPTRDEEANIANCIHAFDDFRNDVEIIVVDNGSTDRTKEIAAGLGAIVLDKGPERSAQRNLGWRTAKNQWVVFLDADMILPEPTICEILVIASFEFQVSNGGESPETNLETPLAYWIPEVRTGEGLRTKARNFERSFYNGTCIDGLRLFHRSLLEKTGGYDENLFAAEDWDLDIRILATGVKCGVLKGNLIHNEKRLTYKRMLEKKAYYTKSFAAYKAKWPDHPAVKKQFSPFYRLVGVFVENGKWLKILRHPILFALVMFERVSVGVVYLANKGKTNG